MDAKILLEMCGDASQGATSELLVFRSLSTTADHERARRLKERTAAAVADAFQTFVAAVLAAERAA